MNYNPVINKEYEEWYEVKDEWKKGKYSHMDVHAMFLIFRAGWLARTNAYEKENLKK